MKIQDFWNQAFLAALHRLGVEEAKNEADLATQRCIEHWQANRNHLSTPRRQLWQDEEIGMVYLSGIAADGSLIEPPISPNQLLAQQREQRRQDDRQQE